MRLRHTDIHIDIYEYIRTYRQKQYGVTAISYIYNSNLDYENIPSQIISTYILDQMLKILKIEKKKNQTKIRQHGLTGLTVSSSVSQPKGSETFKFILILLCIALLSFVLPADLSLRERRNRSADIDILF